MTFATITTNYAFAEDGDGEELIAENVYVAMNHPLIIDLGSAQISASYNNSGRLVLSVKTDHAFILKTNSATADPAPITEFTIPASI